MSARFAATHISGELEYIFSPHWLLRVNLRDHPFPDKLFDVAPGAEIHGWPHDFVPLVGIRRRF